jgi:organic radical activating enzyme
LRLAGCNRGGKGVNGPGCSFCDTRFNYSEGKLIHIKDIEKQIQNLWHSSTTKIHDPLVVVTGGEPLLQESNLKSLIGLKNYIKYQIETNGDFPPESTFPPNTTFVVSPKANEKRKDYKPLHGSWRNQDDVYLKFVVSADPDSPYHNVPDHFEGWNFPIYVSPMAVYKRAIEGRGDEGKAGEVANLWDDSLIFKDATRRNYAYAAELAIKRGFRLSLQTHLLIDKP